MKRIYLSGKRGTGKYFVVDNEDYEKLNKWSWHLDPQGYPATKMSPPRLIVPTSNGQCIDHINHNPLDNRKSNLRACTQSQNFSNRKISNNNTSGYKGVSLLKGKWRAQIGTNCEKIYLGVFKDKKKAALAYNKAALKFHREFALLNKIE